MTTQNKATHAALAAPAPAPQAAAEPVAWAVYWGLPPNRKHSVHFERATAEGVAATIKSATEIRPLVLAAPTGAAPAQAAAEVDATRRSLLPCPFCGRRPVLTVRPDNAEATSYFAAVACFCAGYAACAHKDATASEADEAERLAREKWNCRSAKPQPQAAQPLTDAARDVLAERQRQISAEGWTPEHDDEHADGSLSQAALTYIEWVHGDYEPGTVPVSWPWDFQWFKPSDDRRNLVKAGALILAELERLDRAHSIVATGGEEVCGNCGEARPGCGGLFSSDGRACRFHGATGGEAS